MELVSSHYKDSAPQDFATYVEAALLRIGELPDNWDGDGGKGVTDASRGAIMAALAEVAEEETVLPFLSPTGDGGILAEWTAGVQKVVLEADATGQITVDASDNDGAPLFNGELSNETRDMLRRALADLTVRANIDNPGWRSLFVTPE